MLRLSATNNQLQVRFEHRRFIFAEAIRPADRKHGRKGFFVWVSRIFNTISRDVMRAVPSTQREAMLALGATRWEMITGSVLPYCRSGLIGGVILGLGRALGETMAVTMVIGNSYKLTASLFSPGATIASKVASEFSEASGDLYIGSLITLALVLFGITR